MDKDFIIAEIKRTAAANGGKALGMARFEQETGIKSHEWCGKFWARWGDAVREAGLEPNSMRTAYDRQLILEKLAFFARELGRFPVPGELRLRARNDETFPGYESILRVGKKADIVPMVIEYCSTQSGFEDVLEICRSIKLPNDKSKEITNDDQTGFGYVYLMKSGKHYKIGHSNSAGRREYELAIQLPERLVTVHTISTDDPVGIEAYWHKRFEAKRLNGEWFNLNAADIRAFKRRKFM